jgi:hypothetical protein
MLYRLETNSFTVNPRKCEWPSKEANVLRHWFTPVGIKPCRMKVEAVLNIKDLFK